ncbi:unnamed protein product [Heterobilharzia americana]|nr:unnamed protein product [Heterobilharzia americana]
MSLINISVVDCFNENIMTSTGSYFVCDYIKQTSSSSSSSSIYSYKPIVKSPEQMVINAYSIDKSRNLSIIEEVTMNDDIPFLFLFICYTIDMIWCYIPIILFLIGTIGNILSFLVFYKRTSLYLSSHIYLLLLAIMDEGVLCIGLLRRWLDRLLLIRLEDKHWLLCKSIQFISVTISYISVWIIVFITVERTLVVISPISRVYLNRLKHSYTLLIILCLLACSISLHFFSTVDLVQTMNNVTLKDDIKETISSLFSSSRYVIDEYNYNHIDNISLFNIYNNVTDSFICDFHLQYKMNGFQSIWTWIDASLYSYLPFIIIVISNTIILLNIHSASKRRQSMIYKISNRNYCYHHHNQYIKNCKNNDYPVNSLSIKWNRCIPATEHQQQSSSNYSQSYTNNKIIPPIIQSTLHHHHHQHNDNNINMYCKHNNNNNNRSIMNNKSSSNVYKCKHPCISIKLQPYNGVKGIEYKTSNCIQHSHVILSNEMRQLTLLLMLISCIFLLTTAPVVFIKLLYAWNIQLNRKQMILLELFDCIAEVLMYTNHTINFYLYCAVGKTFRKELRKILKCRRKHQ